MLVEMELREILTTGPITAIVLSEKDGRERQFPIYIGPAEASALQLAVRKDILPPFARPLTHDLILGVLEGLGATLRRVIVDKLVEEEGGGGTFYGKLDVERSDHSTVWIDSRPSDAIVLATKMSVSIWVDEEVLRQVGAEPPPPEPDLE
jgi:hypothetical protein